MLYPPVDTDMAATEMFMDASGSCYFGASMSHASSSLSAYSTNAASPSSYYSNDSPKQPAVGLIQPKGGSFAHHG